MTWPIAVGRMALRAVSSAPVGSAVKGPRSQLVYHASLGREAAKELRCWLLPRKDSLRDHSAAERYVNISVDEIANDLYTYHFAAR